jgi:hypothetical protein
MKLTLISALAFLCGILGGMMFPRQAHRAPAPEVRTVAKPLAVQSPATDAFAEWQQVAKSNSGGEVKARERLAARMAEEDGFRAWQTLTAKNARLRMAEIEALARRWAARNGQEAAEFGLGISDPILRGTFLSIALSRWFGEQPQAMLDWLRAKPERQQHAGRTTALEYYDQLRQDTTALDHLVALSEAGALSAHYANHALRVWRHADQREGVTAWLRLQPASFERDLAWKSIAAELARSDAQAAAKMANEVADDSLRRQITSTAAAQLARSDTKAAFAYTSSLPEGPDRTAAWQSVLGTWALDDPGAALDFVRQHASEISTETIRPVIRQWALNQPAELLRVVQSMPGTEDSRVSIVGDVVSEWRRHSPDGLRSWLTSTAAAWLPESDLKRFQRTANEPLNISSSTRTVQGRRFWSGG